MAEIAAPVCLYVCVFVCDTFNERSISHIKSNKVDLFHPFIYILKRFCTSRKLADFKFVLKKLQLLHSFCRCKSIAAAVAATAIWHKMSLNDLKTCSNFLFVSSNLFVWLFINLCWFPDFLASYRVSLQFLIRWQRDRKSQIKDRTMTDEDWEAEKLDDTSSLPPVFSEMKTEIANQKCMNFLSFDWLHSFEIEILINVHRSAHYPVRLTFKRLYITHSEIVSSAYAPPPVITCIPIKFTIKSAMC